MATVKAEEHRRCQRWLYCTVLYYIYQKIKLYLMRSDQLHDLNTGHDLNSTCTTWPQDKLTVRHIHTQSWLTFACQVFQHCHSVQHRKMNWTTKNNRMDRPIWRANPVTLTTHLLQSGSLSQCGSACFLPRHLSHVQTEGQHPSILTGKQVRF